jgi:hypothetical protein
MLSEPDPTSQSTIRRAAAFGLASAAPTEQAE